MSPKNHEGNGHGLDLDLLIVSYKVCLISQENWMQN